MGITAPRDRLNEIETGDDGGLNFSLPVNSNRDERAELELTTNEDFIDALDTDDLAIRWPHGGAPLSARSRTVGTR